MNERLISQQIADDPRVAQARELLRQTLADHCAAIDGVRPPQQALTASYEEALAEFARLRGGGLYYPYLSSGAGNGPFVELCDGSVKLDMISGIGVHGLGHNHPRMVDAGVNAAIGDTVMQGNLQQHHAVARLSRKLVDTACRNGAALEHVFLTTSGAMANENALKLVFQKNAPANRIMAFRNCFSGRTLALSQLTDKAAYRDGLPDTLSVDYVPFFEPEHPEHSISKTLGVVRRHLQRYPKRHAAMFTEVVQGEGGYNVATRDFFVQMLDLLREHGVAIVFDEIQSFSRTSQPFAFQHYGLDEYADVVTVGKITQICATLFRSDFKPRPGLISQTFTGSAMAMNVCEATLELLESRGNFGDQGLNMALHKRFVENMEAIAARFPGTVHGPYGIGGMMAFTPFDGSADKAKQVAHGLYEAGLIGFVAGQNPTRMRFLPPLATIEMEHIDLACRLIEQVIGAMNDKE